MKRKLPRLEGMSGGPIFVANAGPQTDQTTLSENLLGVLTGIKEDLIIGVSASQIYAELNSRLNIQK